MRLPLIALALITATACSRTPTLDTRTFDLRYIETDAAANLIGPYVYRDRPGAPGTLSGTEHTLTVRETPDNLEKIARVLAEYDKPSPWVRLHFQVIEADGAGRPDVRIADVETELRKLFRFAGYRLMADAQITGTARSGVQQQLGSETGSTYIIAVDIGEVRAVGDSGFVTMHVNLRSLTGAGLQTTVTARDGQTVVLGNAQLTPGEGPTTILTVRPELVRN
jgi:hypothetical protein